MSMEELFGDAEVISVYTRAQAIEDGVLIDVTKTAWEAGFTLPAVVTLAARRTPAGNDLAKFKVSVVDGQSAGGFPHREQHELWLHVGPGDGGEPVITIMRPDDW